MCIEHKQYWQCCLTIDSRYIDPCPTAGSGLRCQMYERVHPIGGYCTSCRVQRNKVEEDEVTSPLYTRNDGYDRPWAVPEEHEPLPVIRYRHVSSQAQGSERGRTMSLRRQSEEYDKDEEDNGGPAPVPVTPTFSYYHNQQPVVSQTSISNEEVRLDKDDSHRRSHSSSRSKTKHKRDHRRHHHHRHHRESKSPEPAPEPVQYRVASPRTIQRLQEQGVLPPLEQLQYMQLPKG